MALNSSDHTTRTRWLPRSPTLAACLVCSWIAAHGALAADDPASGDPAIKQCLQPILEQYHVPALAGAVVTSQGWQSGGVVGVRKAGTTVPATTNDSWHLGSDTKAMTATLVGRLVEQGVLRWETTVTEVFPELAASFNPAFRSVTLTLLLTHRAGLPANLSWGRLARTGTVAEQRAAAVKEALTGEPRSTPGTKFEYSNLGYVIVGAMIERRTGKSWEAEMQQEVFAPLGMKHVGFGGLGTPGNLDQPWSHTASNKPTPKNGPDVDNPPVIGPAGRVHCPLADWARFVTDQLRGARGEDGLLKAATYRTIQTPPAGADYALGWGTAQRDWGGGTVLTHAGCNTMNYAVAWLAPARDFAVLICANQGDDAAAKATDAAAAALIRLHNASAKR